MFKQSAPVIKLSPDAMEDDHLALLGLLNMDYVSTFFGRNLLREDAAPGRALIGN